MKILQISLLTTGFIFSLNTFAMMDAAASQESSKSLIKIQQIFDAQTHQIKYLDTVLELLRKSSSEVDRRHLIKIFVDKSAYLDALLIEDLVGCFILDFERYRLLRLYLQNFAHFLLTTPLEEGRRNQFLSLFRREIRAATRSIAGDVRKFNIWGLHPQLAENEVTFLTSFALALAHEDEQAELDLDRDLFETIMTEAGKGTVESQIAARQKAQEFSQDFGEYTVAKERLVTVCDLIDKYFNGVVGEEIATLREESVRKEFLARFSSYILSIATPLWRNDIDLKKISEFIDESYLTVHPASDKSKPPFSVASATNNTEQDANKKSYSRTQKSGKKQKHGKSRKSNKSGRGKARGHGHGHGKKNKTVRATTVLHVVKDQEDVALKTDLLSNAISVNEEANDDKDTHRAALLTETQATIPVANDDEESEGPADSYVVTKDFSYKPTPYEEYLRRGGTNREWKQKLYLQHVELLKGKEPVVETVAAEVFNKYERELFDNVIFGAMHKWQVYSWNDIMSLLIRAGWKLSKSTGSSTVQMTPRQELHGILGSHTIGIHGAHEPNAKPVPTYCIDYLKAAFKHSYGLKQSHE